MSDATESTRKRRGLHEGCTREVGHWRGEQGVVSVPWKAEVLHGEG